MKEEHIMLFDECCASYENKEKIDFCPPCIKGTYYVTEHSAVIYADGVTDIYMLTPSGWKIEPLFLDLWYDDMTDFMVMPIEMVEKYQIPKFEDKYRYKLRME